ncbi:MAG: hypothetical protein ABID87_03100 [Chloroflexota bacterium]
MSQFEMSFGNGTAEATNPQGPLLGNGALGNIKAYLKLQNLQGLHCDKITSPTKVSFQFLDWPRWRFGQWRIILPIPWIRIIKFSKSYVDMSLNIVGALNYQNPPLSQHPSPPGTQVQVYDGSLRLSWASTEMPDVLLWPSGAPMTGLGGSTDIQVRVILSYNIIIDPVTNQPVIVHPDTGQSDGIKGELTGDMQPPVLPGADPHVTGNFDSLRPLNFGEPVVTFEVNNVMLRGNWL